MTSSEFNNQRRRSSSPSAKERIPDPQSFHPQEGISSGSRYTTYIPPAESVNSTIDPSRLRRRRSKSPSPPTFRPGQETLRAQSSDSDIPDLIPVTEGDNEPWNSDASRWTEYIQSEPVSNVPIHGRSDKEEQLWWDENVRRANARPGPGLIPAFVEETVSMGGCTLYSVEIQLQDDNDDSDPGPRQAPLSSISPTIPAAAATFGPQQHELLSGKPHPKAVWRPDQNDWVVVVIHYGSLPPLVPSGDPNGWHLPDPTCRSATRDCQNTETPDRLNLTHHLHHYNNATHISTLEPPLQRSSWLHQKAPKQPPVEQPPDEDFLDLYVCCQCSLYCQISKPIPGVIPARHLRQLVQDREDHPSLGMGVPQSVFNALDVLLRCVSWNHKFKALNNNVFLQEKRSLSITGKAFQKLGSTSTSVQIFESLNYTYAKGNSNGATLQQDAVSPPIFDTVSLEGRYNRARLIRAWLETNAYIQHMADLYGFGLPPAKAKQPRINIAIPTEIIPGDSKPGLSVQVLNDPSDRDCLRSLGMTPSSFASDMTEFAYRAQCRCDPQHTPEYLTCVRAVAVALPVGLSLHKIALENLIVFEISRGRWTMDMLKGAASALGFGKDNDLKLEWNREIDDDFALRAWKDAMRRAWSNSTTSAQKRKELTESLRMLAEHRESVTLIKAIDDHKFDMDPDQAFRALEVPKDIDESMLLMVYNMRVEEQPHQLERMKQALDVIAEYKNSPRLQNFLRDGFDSGDSTQQHPSEWPRGLNQLGNTCYLNSLLQYFYTISDLRNAIASVKDYKADADSDDDMSKYRVGGRLVSRREIQRSKQFVHQLANLFADLKSAENPSVTPSLELAKLALVTSRDEEDGLKTSQPGTDSSNSTDATLVEEPIPRSLAPATENAQSVLGKRGRNETDVSMQAAGTETSEDGINRPSQAPPLPPRRRTESKLDSVMMFGKQHDVAECMDNCLFQIEAALLPNSSVEASVCTEKSIIKNLFYGTMRQQLTPADMDLQKADNSHVKDDVFSHLPVNVSSEAVDLYDGLDCYFDDTVDFNGTLAKMHNSIIDLPPILQIQLQRVQFDKKLGQPFKSQSYVKFGETLFMDRYLNSVEPSKQSQSRTLRDDLSSCRSRINALTGNGATPYGSHLANASAFLAQHGHRFQGTATVQNAIGDEKARLSSHLENLRGQAESCKAKITALWDSERRMEYELTSVFIHRGSSPSFGHYFFYARHLPENPDSWFKMNDNEVTMVQKDEVLADTSGSSANAYLLVYARKGSGVIQTVQREQVVKVEEK